MRQSFETVATVGTSTRVERHLASGAGVALAIQRVTRYCANMVVDLIRRIAAVAVSLALVLGPAAGGVYAASMGATMVSTATTDAHSTGACNDCGTTKSGMSVAACVATYCSSLTAFSTDTKFTFEVLSADTFASSGAGHVSGRAEAPEPYPPKAIILN